MGSTAGKTVAEISNDLLFLQFKSFKAVCVLPSGPK
jgi:hypothetical protein